MTATTQPELAAFDDILTLARRQLEALRSDNVDAYLDLSTQREIVMQSMPTLRDSDLRQRARVLLQAAAEIDAKSDVLIQAGLADVRTAMGQLRQGHQAIRGYQQQPTASTHSGALA